MSLTIRVKRVYYESNKSTGNFVECKCKLYYGESTKKSLQKLGNIYKRKYFNKYGDLNEHDESLDLSLLNQDKIVFVLNNGNGQNNIKQGDRLEIYCYKLQKYNIK